MTATQTPGRGSLPGDVNPAGGSQQPRPGTETPDERADRLLRIGLDVATRIRDEDPNTVAHALNHLDQRELRDLTILLAGALDLSTTVRVWYGWLPITAVPACGTIAAEQRHRRQGQPIDDACREARNRYNRQREHVRAAALTAVHTDRRPAFFDHPNRGCLPPVNPEWFFPENGHDGIPIAKGICAACPVAAACREFAVADPSIAGIWGGTTARERQRIRKQRAKEQAA